MDTVLYLPFYKGVVIDYISSTTSNNLAQLKKSNHGVVLYCSTAKGLSIAKNLNLGFDSWAIDFFVFLRPETRESYLLFVDGSVTITMYKHTASTYGIGITGSSISVNMYSIPLIVNMWTHYTLVYDRNTLLFKVYVNGSFLRSVSIATQVSLSFAFNTINILCYLNNYLVDNSNISYFKISRGVPTQDEVNNMYKFALNLKPISISPKTTFSELNTYGYGYLYNWYAVNTGKLAPIGWHVPTDAEFTTMVNYLGGASVAGGKLKSKRWSSITAGWIAPNTNACNCSGFNGLPSGYRSQTDGSFSSISTSTYYLSNELWVYRLSNLDSNYNRIAGNAKFGGVVRCVMDTPANYKPGMGVKDIDGNIYPTVVIGNQVWTTTNLKTTRYNDGTAIPNVTDNSAWAALTTGAYCSYNNTALVEYSETIYPKIKDLHFTFDDLICDGNAIVPNGMVKGTGVVKGVVEATGSSVLAKWKKAFQFTTAGTMAISTNWDCGTISGKVYKGADANIVDILFMATNTGNVTATGQNAYVVRYGSDEKFYLYKTTNGVLSAALITSANTYAITTWTDWKVTKTEVTGVFILYVNNVSVGTVTDTSFTTGNFVVFDGDVLDREAKTDVVYGIIK